METGAFWALTGVLITATVTGIALIAHLRTASQERLEAIYERLLSELNNVVIEMGGWNGTRAKLSVRKKRTISRMLHLHLDSLVESVAVEGRSGLPRWWYRLRVGKCKYEEVAGKWFYQKHRYQRFEYWYSGTLRLYNDILGASTYVEEVFHLAKDDPHKGIGGMECLKQYFKKRLKEFG